MIPHEHDETVDLLVLSLKAYGSIGHSSSIAKGAGICDTEEA
jgi:hypothetical protein